MTKINKKLNMLTILNVIIVICVLACCILRLIGLDSINTSGNKFVILNQEKEDVLEEIEHLEFEIQKARSIFAIDSKLNELGYTKLFIEYEGTGGLVALR